MAKRDYYISEAINKAKESKMKCKHGAVIVKGGKIIRAGHNDRLHAECEVVGSISRKLRKRKKQYLLQDGFVCCQNLAKW